jgi:hypothetical protein
VCAGPVTGLLPKTVDRVLHRGSEGFRRGLLAPFWLPLCVVALIFSG